MATKAAATPENFEWVFAKFAAPKAHCCDNTNAEGPIVGVEVTLALNGAFIFWSTDGDCGVTAYASVEQLCATYGFNFDEVSSLVAAAFEEQAPNVVAPSCA